MKNIKYLLLSAILIGFTACNDEEDFVDTQAELPALTAGTANFSTYVSIGNSLTAGYTDGALFIAGQENSFPNTLAKQFALVGGNPVFKQPLANDNIGGLILAGNPVFHPVSGDQLFTPRFVTTGGPPQPLADVIGPIQPTTDFLLNNPTGPFNNLGVPGAKGFHLLAPGFGSIANFPAAANPYAIRVAGNTDASIISLAVAQSPTFFSLWAGNNDVLLYAVAGGDVTIEQITPQPLFDGAYASLIAQLSGSQGVVANIPYVTTIPHFTTVPHNPLDPSNPAFGPQIPVLNATFAGLNGAFAFLGMPERSIVFSETAASPVVIHDESLPNIQPQLNAVLMGGGLDAATAGVLSAQFAQSRQATADDLLVLSSSSVIATVNVPYYTYLVTNGVPAATAGQLSVNGVTFPLADKWVLIPAEQDEIKMATDNYNTTIKNAAMSANPPLAFVDANSLMQDLDNGGFVDGDFILTSALVSGGAFSLDGVHPTARGYALLANEFMKAIDVTYGSNFEASGNLVDIGIYPTNYNPALALQ